MSFTPNTAAIAKLLNSTTGPVGIHIAKKASLVYEQAVINTSGPILNRRSGRLQDLLRVQLIGTPQGAQATVGTTARSSWRGAPFNYPAHLERLGFIWLTSALKAAFLLRR
jgi:hypothetical protein